MNIDIEKLREDLIDYFGSALAYGYPMAIVDITDVEMASETELINIAKESGFNPKNYKI